MNRYVSSRAATLALGIASTLCFTQPAAAGPTVPHKETSDGTVTFTAPDALTFKGPALATHLGRYSTSGGNQTTADGRIINGTFKSIAADGSTISGTYSGTFTPLANNKVRFNVDAVWVRGTGRLAGVTGRGSVVAIVDLNTNTYH